MADYSEAIWPAQFTALRQEILQRTTTEYQLMALAPVGLGTYLTLALRDPSQSWLLVPYPFLVLFLALAWSHQEAAIVTVADYIRQHHEVQRDDSVMWETFLAERRIKNGRRDSFLTKFGESGVVDTFVGCQATALTVAWISLLLSGFSHAESLFAMFLVGGLLVGALTWRVIKAGARIPFDRQNDSTMLPSQDPAIDAIS